MVEIKDDPRMLKALKAYRMEHERYRYYEPNGVGEEFINALKTDDYLICFISAANGVGKTALASNIIANLCFPGNNPWFTGGVFDKWPHLKRGRIVTDSALVDKNVVSELKFWMPETGYTTNKGGKHFESVWSTNTGWSWDIMTYDQDPEQFEGVTLGWAWFDEPPPDAILKATIARMRRGGIIFITATPISGSAHLYDLFASGRIETTIQLREGDDPQKVERRIFHMTADVESVCKQHGIRGHLEHEHIVQMVAEYPEDERQARVYGKFQHLIGLVYKMWSRDIHVIEPFELDPKDFVVYHALDPHPRNEDAGLWIAVDRKGTKYVVDEYYGNPENVKKLAWEVKKKNSLYRMQRPFLLDPSAFIVDQHTERCLATMLEEAGLSYIPASKARAAADARIKTALNYQAQNGDLIKPPELYVFSNCTRFIYEMEHYRWAEWKGKIADERNRKETPVDKDDHTIECVTGDTRVRTVHGDVEIASLVGTEGLVVTPFGLKRYRDVRKTKEEAGVFNVVFENGKRVVCTADHLFLTTNGVWVPAFALVGRKVLDIGQWNGYTRTYGKDTHTNRTGVFGKAVLLMWSLLPARRFSVASGRLGALSQKEGSGRASCTPQRWGRSQQPDRQLGATSQNSALETAWEVIDRCRPAVEARKSAKKCNTSCDSVAQVSESEVAQKEGIYRHERLLEEQKTRGLQKLLGMWKTVRYISALALNVLLASLQGKAQGSRCVAVEYVGKKDVYNMEVEDVHCFSVNGGIVVHNCAGRILFQEPRFVDMGYEQGKGIMADADFDPYQ